MKKLAVLCIAALGAALMAVGTAPAASAYPELTCNVTVDKQVVYPGESFTATGTAAEVESGARGADATQAQWTFRWNGETKKRVGAVVQASFTAPQVKKSRKITLTARSTTSAGSCVHRIDITVAVAAVAGPEGEDGDGPLPNTGGPAFWLLVAGLVLLVGGGTLVARRRS